MKSAGRDRLRRPLALVAACLLLVAGCRGSGTTDDPTISVPETTLAPETTVATTATTATTTLIPLDQDPPVIDLAYAQRVLDEISRLEGEASRILYQAKAVTPEYEALIHSFLYGDALSESKAAVEDDLSVGLASYRDPPGDPIVTGRQIISSRQDCIALLADSDFGPRYKSPIKKQQGIGILLQRNVKPTAEEKLRNPSNWVQTGGGRISTQPGQALQGVCE